MGASGLEDGVVGAAGLRVDSVRSSVHLDLVEIVPERAKVHEVLRTNFDEVGVNGIVGLAAVGRNTSYGSLVMVLSDMEANNLLEPLSDQVPTSKDDEVARPMTEF